MSLNTTSSFKEYTNGDNQTLSEAVFKPSTGVMDSHWDLVMADFAYKNNTPKSIIPYSTCPPLPKDTTNWTIGGNKTMFDMLLDVVKSGIGRGEVSLFWAFNYKKTACRAPYAGNDGFNWNLAVRLENDALWKKYCEDNKLKHYNPPSRAKREPARIQEAMVDDVYKFMLSREILNAGKKASPTTGFLQTNSPSKNGASENPSKGDGADLIIEGRPVEVKAYDSLTKKIKIGKVSNQGSYKPLDLVSTLFSFHNLFASFTGSAKTTMLKANNWHAHQLKTALASFQTVRDLFDGIKDKGIKNSPAFKSVFNVMSEMEVQFDVFAKVKVGKGDLFPSGSANLTKLISKLDIKETSEVNKMAGAVIMKGIIIKKLMEKPGDVNFFFNVDKQKNLMWHLVDFTRITDDPDKLEKASMESNNLFMNFQDIEK